MTSTCKQLRALPVPESRPQGLNYETGVPVQARARGGGRTWDPVLPGLRPCARKQLAPRHVAVLLLPQLLERGVRVQVAEGGVPPVAAAATAGVLPPL